MFDCNFNREGGKSHRCIRFIASSSANRLGLLIAIPSVKFRKDKKISINAFAQMGCCLHTLPMAGHVASGWVVLLGDFILWEGAGGGHGN